MKILYIVMLFSMAISCKKENSNTKNPGTVVTLGAILDLSGMKITELSGRGTAGMDNEVTWNVSNIQSGVYLARVEAHSANKSEVVFIKIAVVK